MSDDDGVHLTVVDAFTDRPFSGNPAAVALLPAFGADERLHAIAAEMNLSESRRCLIVTAAAESGSGHDFVSRVFAPNVGIAEDPVTSSAHCALAAYWAPRLGRTELTGHQASRRGGTVRVRVEGERVVLAGKAVTVSEVELVV